MLTSCILPSETWINTGIFPMQIEQRVHFDGSLLLAKLRPGKQRQAEIDGGRVQRVEAVIQFHAHGIARVKRSRDTDQYLCEVGEDAPVVGLVGQANRGPRKHRGKAEMIAFRTRRAETGLD